MNNNINETVKTPVEETANAPAPVVPPVEEEYHTYYFEMTDGLIVSAIGRSRAEAYRNLMGF